MISFLTIVHSKMIERFAKVRIVNEEAFNPFFPPLKLLNVRNNTLIFIYTTRKLTKK